MMLLFPSILNNLSILPLAATDCTPSLTTAQVRILAWACEKVASDLGLGSGFGQVLRFSPLPTTG